MMRAFLCLIWIVLALPLHAAGSDMVVTRTLSAQIVTAQDGVPAGSAAVSAGLRFVLEPGWKTYWRSPGEVGLPPDISWEGSDNIRDIALSFPAPKRFTAFEIENFGYADEVLFPLQVQLERPGAPARLALEATVLVCAEVCIPETVNLTLDLPAGAGIDGQAAGAIAQWIAKVPDDGAGSGLSLDQVYLDENVLVVRARSAEPMARPDIFPEHGEYASFGKPEIVLGDGAREMWARLPVLAPGEGAVQITLTDGARAATLPVAELAAEAPARPQATAALLGMVFIALLGGLILNVMPCVLPVLSIKLTAALGAAGQAPGRVRAGFLASAAGVLAFFWGLAGVVLAMQASGASFGWGIQFQHPVFLSFMAVVVILFAANLLGAFEIILPQNVNTGLAQAEGRGGWGGDFATGAFAALLATPCSAPFLGTAVTYALTNGPREVVAIFTALGLGLALPYLLVAARPAWLAKLPKPGRWMMWVKWTMGAFLAATAVWLLSVLVVVSGWGMVAFVAGIAVVIVLALSQGRVLAGGALAAVAVAVVALTPTQQDVTQVLEGWEVFDEAAIVARVAGGETVFVDVTADWCITCKANKTLVLERGTVAEALDAVTLMRADWTRPSDTILSYLQMHDRFGIPFNIVYGPGAPEGIVLPELLTSDAVLAALETAQGVE